MTTPVTIVRAQGAIVALRIVSSTAWLQSALIGKDAKLSPDFFGGAGLASRVNQTFVHTALAPPIAQALRTIVVPHAAIFAAAIALGDLAIGVSLLLGVFTRLGGALAIVRALTNILVAGGGGADTIGFNGMLATAGAIALVTASGRRLGIDRWLLTRAPASWILRLTS